MHVNCRALRGATVFGILCLIMGLQVSAAHAVDAVRVARSLIRAKVLREAGDRYDVKFLTTTVVRYSPHEKRVTGTGMFRRHGKRPQDFTFHSIVNTLTAYNHDTGYKLR